MFTMLIIKTLKNPWSMVSSIQLPDWLAVEFAGTAPDKEDEENKNTDEEMKDVSKKDGGKY